MSTLDFNPPQEPELLSVLDLILAEDEMADERFYAFLDRLDLLMDSRLAE